MLEIIINIASLVHRALDITQLAGTARERRNSANDGVVRVILRNRQVQSLQALCENIHYLRGDFADVGVL